MSRTSSPRDFRMKLWETPPAAFLPKEKKVKTKAKNSTWQRIIWFTGNVDKVLFLLARKISSHGEAPFEHDFVFICWIFVIIANISFQWKRERIEARRLSMKKHEKKNRQLMLFVSQFFFFLFIPRFYIRVLYSGESLSSGRLFLPVGFLRFHHVREIRR